jgi:hypothetical protein
LLRIKSLLTEEAGLSFSSLRTYFTRFMKVRRQLIKSSESFFSLLFSCPTSLSILRNSLETSTAMPYVEMEE